MPNKDRRGRELWLIYVLADFAAVVAAYYTAYLVRFHSSWGERFFDALNGYLGVRAAGPLGGELEQYYLENALRIILIITGICLFLYSLRDLYPGRRFIRGRPVFWNVVVANAVALGLFYARFYLQRNVFHPRSFFFTVLVLNSIYCADFRALADGVLSAIRTRFQIDQWPATLVGRGRELDAVSGIVERSHPHGIYVADRVDTGDDTPFEAVLRRVESSVRERAARMIICVDTRLTVSQIMEFLDLAERLGVACKVLSGELRLLASQAHVATDRIYGMPLVHFEASAASKSYCRFKQVVSRVGGYVGLVVLSPLLGAVALSIKLTSPGSIWFIQERIGVNRKPFPMYKFRTMYDRAEEQQAQLEEFNECGTGLFKIEEDPRVTRVGKILRQFSIDELPQLINAARGDMVIVGPRPLPRRDFENYYEDWHYSRHAGMPGMTCLWQVSGRSEVDFHGMCVLDVYYLRNQNWMLDVMILLRTVWVVLFAKGAY